jgi:hypothetical protein
MHLSDVIKKVRETKKSRLTTEDRVKAVREHRAAQLREAMRQLASEDEVKLATVYDAELLDVLRRKTPAQSTYHFVGAWQCTDRDVVITLRVQVMHDGKEVMHHLSYFEVKKARRKYLVVGPKVWEANYVHHEVHSSQEDLFTTVLESTMRVGASIEDTEAPASPTTQTS